MTKPLPHGTRKCYNSHGCRLPACRKAEALYTHNLRRRKQQRLLEDPTLAPHGLNSTYTNWRCRCTLCKAAHTGANNGRT